MHLKTAALTEAVAMEADCFMRHEVRKQPCIKFRYIFTQITFAEYNEGYNIQCLIFI